MPISPGFWQMTFTFWPSLKLSLCSVLVDEFQSHCWTKSPCSHPKCPSISSSSLWALQDSPCLASSGQEADSTQSSYRCQHWGSGGVSELGWLLLTSVPRGCMGLCRLIWRNWWRTDSTFYYTIACTWESKTPEIKEVCSVIWCMEFAHS